MAKYVVALYSNFNGSMLKEEVEAESVLAAGMKVLVNEEWDLSNTKIDSCVALQEFVFNCDHTIGIVEI